MKTTIEISDKLFRQAKQQAAHLGVSLKALFHEALSDKLHAPRDGRQPASPAHMKGFGKLRRWRKETQRVQKIIDEEFSRIDPEEWK